jgi:hypothetical protein
MPANSYGLGRTANKKPWMSFSRRNGAPRNGDESRPRTWICGGHSPTALPHGPPNCRIVYDKFHVLQHANKAADECAGRSSSAKVGACAVW